MIVLVYCVLSLFNCMICLCCPPAVRDILHTSVARYSLFVLKVPLNLKHLVADTCRGETAVFCSCRPGRPVSGNDMLDIRDDNLMVG